jgi:hypothetical protein
VEGSRTVCDDCRAILSRAAAIAPFGDASSAFLSLSDGHAARIASNGIFN